MPWSESVGCRILFAKGTRCSCWPEIWLWQFQSMEQHAVTTSVPFTPFGWSRKCPVCWDTSSTKASVWSHSKLHRSSGSSRKIFTSRGTVESMAINRAPRQSALWSRCGTARDVWYCWKCFLYSCHCHVSHPFGISPGRFKWEFDAWRIVSEKPKCNRRRKRKVCFSGISIAWLEGGGENCAASSEVVLIFVSINCLVCFCLMCCWGGCCSNSCK